MTPAPHWHNHALIANGQIICPVCAHKHVREFMYPTRGSFEDPKRNPKNFALYRRPDGQLVLTTPNAYRVLNFLAPVSGAELVHPDHTAWHSPRTLRTLLQRNGWVVDEVGYYRNPWRRVVRADGLRPFLVGHAANLARATLGATGRLAPYWSDGIVVWARPAGTP